MEIATIAVMIAAFIGMIICAKKQKTNPNAKTIAILTPGRSAACPAR